MKKLCILFLFSFVFQSFCWGQKYIVTVIKPGAEIKVDGKILKRGDRITLNQKIEFSRKGDYIRIKQLNSTNAPITLRRSMTNQGPRGKIMGIIRDYILPHKVSIGTKGNEAVLIANNKAELKFLAAGLFPYRDTLQAEVAQPLLFIGSLGKLFLRKKGFRWAAKKPDFRLIYGTPYQEVKLSASVDANLIVVYLDAKDFMGKSIHTIHNATLIGVFGRRRLPIGSFKPVFISEVPADLVKIIQREANLLKKQFKKDPRKDDKIFKEIYDILAAHYQASPDVNSLRRWINKTIK